MKVGFVVTAHCSDELRPEGIQYIKRYCDTLNEYCAHDFNLYVVDNASTYDLPLPDNANKIRIEDQTIKGITGAWNLGINQAYEDGCEIIINCNDDLWFNDTINNFIRFIETHFDSNVIYAPLTNGVLGGSQFANSPSIGIQIKKGHDIVNGFCFAMTRPHYEIFRFTDKEYFNVNNKYNGGDGKWGGQEGQFIENSERGLYGIVVNECFIPHSKLRGWKQLVRK